MEDYKTKEDCAYSLKSDYAMRVERQNKMEPKLGPSDQDMIKQPKAEKGNKQAGA